MRIENWVPLLVVDKTKTFAKVRLLHDFWFHDFFTWPKVCTKLNKNYFQDVVQRDSGMYSPEESLMVPPITTNLSQDTQELITAIGVNGHAEYFGHQTTRTASPASIYYEHSNQHRDEQSSVKPKKSLRNFFSAILRRKKMKRAALQAMLEGGNNVGSVPRSMNEYAIVEEDAVST